MKEKFVTLQKFAETMGLVNLTPEVPVEGVRITEINVSRPAMSLVGHSDYLTPKRIQIVGLGETRYLSTLDEDVKAYRLKLWMEKDFPCIIYCRGQQPEEIVLKTAVECGKPLFYTEMMTSEFMAEVIRWLSVQLAPSIIIHGVLVDVYGVGVLITGESGIGKSEAALELIRRGHRLVGDDAVELRKVSEETIVGTAPDLTRFFLELRGIGIIDIRRLFGIERVLETQSVSLVIHLEEWDKTKRYNRFGLEEEYVEYLGNKIPCHNIPVRPGRNLAVIVEAAAINHRQKKMGYNATEELQKRAEELQKKKEQS